MTTKASIESITEADLRGFHQAWFHPRNFVVAVSGDFDRKTMLAKLEALFAKWPHQGQVAKPVPTNKQFAKPGAPGLANCLLVGTGLATCP